MKKATYFIVICEEIDMFNGKVIHINEKAKNLEDAYSIMLRNICKYPNAEWHLCPAQVVY